MNKNKWQVIFAFLCLLLVILLFQIRHRNLSNYYYTDTYIKNVLKSLKPNAILFSLKDNELFPLWNKQITEYIRPDIKVISIMLLSEEWYVKQIVKKYPDLFINMNLTGTFSKEKIRKTMLSRLIIDNMNNYPVYFANKKEKKNFPELNFIPTGVTYRITKNEWEDNQSILYYEFEKHTKFLDTMTKIVFQNYAFNMSECSRHFLLKDILDLSEYSVSISKFLNDAIGMSINNIHNMEILGNIKYKQKDITTAIKIWEEAIRLQPNSSIAKTLRNTIAHLSSKVDYKNISNRAEFYYKNQNYVMAIKYYNKILEVDINNEGIYCNIGDCYFNMRKYDKAINYYNKAIELNPKFGNAYYNLGGCYHQLKNSNMAANTWKTGLKNDPDNEKLISILKKIGYNPKN